MDKRIIGRGLAFPLQVNPSGGVALTSLADEIEQAIAIILGTAVGERVLRLEFGSRLHELSFAPLDEATMALARRYVEDALGRWEPRIRLLEVEVTGDHIAGCLLIALHYVISSTYDRRTLVYPFYLIAQEE
jgi:phage baseplate assembly protein W